MKMIKKLFFLGNIFVFNIYTDQNSFTNYDKSFWSNQQQEHAEFCIDFAKNPHLKKEGEKIALQFEKLKNTCPADKELISLTKKIKKFQKKVLQDLDPKDKDYTIKVDLIEHMNLEANYILRKMHQVLSKKDEIAFWKKEHEGEAKAISYFMINKADAKQPNLLVSRLKNETEQPSAESIIIANQELEELGKILEENPGMTRLPHKLANHEHRERLYAATILTDLP